MTHAASGVTVPPTALQRAIAWLRDVLSNGPLPVKQVEARAGEAGIARRTLKRARARLGVTSRPDGFGGPRLLELPQGLATGGQGHGVDPVPESVDPEKPSPEPGVDRPQVHTDHASVAVARTAARQVTLPVPERPGIRRVKLRRLR